MQGPLAQLSPRVCPTACWAIGKQLVSQINLMMVSCVLNTPWGTGFSEEKPVSAPVSSLFSQTTSERLLAQRQGIELCYLASNVQVKSVRS